MNVLIDIDSASAEPAPDDEDIRSWIIAVLDGRRAEAEVSVRLVDTDEMTQLNETYRGRNGPTNVLSFPADLPPDVEHPLLGDIVVCVPVVRREAGEQGKTEDAHWAHMLVHGTLHLLGYDHIEEAEAEEMESLETVILSRLNYPSPYQTHNCTRSNND